jgi:hypothetical protein
MNLKGENMGENMKLRAILIAMLLMSIPGCGSSTDTATDASGAAGAFGNTPDTSSVLVPCDLDPNEQCMEITLPCTEPEVYGKAGWYIHSCEDEVIQIPNGRPIYALLVSGFHQNKNFEMFHFYNFAKCIFERTKHHDKKAYVHFAWWNNILAPYMEKPLHNDESVPSKGGGALQALPDYLGFLYDQNAEPGGGPGNLGDVPSKAIPAEDYQFQKDARTLLIEIRRNNPDASIILVGHSMGGDAVVRLADSLDDPNIMPEDVPVIDIDLLAPIDPVGNRTCPPNSPLANPGQMEWYNTTCNGAYNFTRFQATHDDWYWWPYRISYKNNNIKYLFHRWQNEAAFPFDWRCPLYTEVLGVRIRDAGCPLQLHMLSLPLDESVPPDAYLFRHNDPRKLEISQGSTNVQNGVPMSALSGTDVYPDLDYYWNWGGASDGHGEIVGFRAIMHTNPLESYPLALAARGDWPSLATERAFANAADRAAVRDSRISHLRAWETDPYYLDVYHGLPGDPQIPFAPEHPEYCKVSGDLCSILASLDQLPVADAGPDRTVECSGPGGAEVTLDGSGSTDPNDDPLTFTWTGPFGTMAGETVYPYLPLGTHTITLTVDDGEGHTDSDTVDVTVTDSTPPALSVSLSPNTLWPPNHKLVSVAASIQVTDTCDDSPNVELVSIVSNEADNGPGDGNTDDDIQGAGYGTDDRAFSLRAERAGTGDGRLYTVTYRAGDGEGNTAGQSAEVRVPHDHGGGGGLP